MQLAGSLLTPYVGQKGSGLVTGASFNAQPWPDLKWYDTHLICILATCVETTIQV